MIFHFNDSNIFYTRSGAGSAVILLHGFLESSTMWRFLAPTLEKKHTVITIDLPGFGQSDNVATVHSMQLMAQITSEILKVEKISEATVIGHSMGGYVALELTKQSPSVVKKLILLNSTPAKDSPQRVAHRQRAIGIIDKNKDAFVSMAIANLFTKEERKMYQIEIELLKKEALQISLQGLKAAIIGMAERGDNIALLAAFNKPKLMLSGSEDPIVPLPVATNICEKTNTDFHRLKGGHMLWLTNRSEIEKIVHFIE